MTLFLLGPWIRRFLLEHLVGERNLSRNTQRSYRDTLALLMPFASSQLKKTVDQISPTDLSADLLRGFLTDLEQSRGCGITTRNQRLAAIHALANFVGLHSPEHIAGPAKSDQCPSKKLRMRRYRTWRSRKWMHCWKLRTEVLAPGRRDHALLLFLYNTGARADEAAQALIGDLDLAVCNRDYSSVSIRGKGNKMRRCPLWPQTVEELRPLTEGRASTERLFLNRCGQPTTRFRNLRSRGTIRQTNCPQIPIARAKACEPAFHPTHDGNPSPSAPRRRHQYNPRLARPCLPHDDQYIRGDRSRNEG